jgi:hypothetical protein
MFDMKRGNMNWLVVFLLGLLVLIVVLSFLPSMRNALFSVFDFIGLVV